MAIEVISRTQYDGGIDLGINPVWQCPPDIQAGDLLLLLETQWGSYWIDDAGHPNGGYNFTNFPAGVIELQGALQGGGFSSFFGYKFATDASDSNGTITVTSNTSTNNWATTLIQVRGLDPSVTPIDAGVSDGTVVTTRNPLPVSGLTDGTTYFGVASIVPYGSPIEALSDGNITGQDHKFVQHQDVYIDTELSDLGVSEYHNHVASGGAWQAGGFWNTYWVAAMLKSACFEALPAGGPPTIFFGSNPIEVGSLKLGGSNIAKVYHGASEIWPPAAAVNIGWYRSYVPPVTIKGGTSRSDTATLSHAGDIPAGMKRLIMVIATWADPSAYGKIFTVLFDGVAPDFETMYQPIQLGASVSWIEDDVKTSVQVDIDFGGLDVNSHNIVVYELHVPETYSVNSNYVSDTSGGLVLHTLQVDVETQVGGIMLGGMGSLNTGPWTVTPPGILEYQTDGNTQEYHGDLSQEPTENKPDQAVIAEFTPPGSSTNRGIVIVVAVNPAAPP